MNKKLVFLFDVDNTLLDNDLVTADLIYVLKALELEDVKRRYHEDHYCNRR